MPDARRHSTLPLAMPLLTTLPSYYLAILLPYYLTIQMRAIIEARNESEMLEVLTRSLEKDLDERESALNVARAA